MNKTKVKVSPLLLDYQSTMAQWLEEAREEKLKYAAQTEENLEPFDNQVQIPAFEQAGLLTPPQIECVTPNFYWREGGGIEGIIHVITSDVYGIVSISLTLRDEAGNLLESGQAMRDEQWVGYWSYLPRLTPTVGTSVIVRAVAADALGGLSIAEEKLAVTEKYLRMSTDSLRRRGNT